MNSVAQSSLDTVVIKIGTDVIATPEGALDTDVMRQLAEQIAEVRQSVRRLAIVTSGAVAAGRAILGKQKYPGETIVEKQKYAIVGQVPLMTQWAKFLGEYDIMAGQVLLTGKNFDSKSVCDHLQDGLDALFADDSAKIVPVCNANDAIDIGEVKFSDNDFLAAHLAHLLRAQKALLLSKSHGIQRSLADASSVITSVAPGSRECEQYVSSETSGNGTGGASSKIRVGEWLAERGIETTIAYGREQDIIRRILLRGEALGTTFQPAARP